VVIPVKQRKPEAAEWQCMERFKVATREPTRSAAFGQEPNINISLGAGPRLAAGRNDPNHPEPMALASSMPSIYAGSLRTVTSGSEILSGVGTKRNFPVGSCPSELGFTPPGKETQESR